MSLPPSPALLTATTLEEVFALKQAPSTSPTLLARYMRQRVEAMRGSLSASHVELLMHYHAQALAALEAGLLGSGVALTRPCVFTRDDLLEVGSTTVCIQEILDEPGDLIRARVEHLALRLSVHLDLASTPQATQALKRATQALERMEVGDPPQQKHLPRRLGSGLVNTSGQFALLLIGREYPTLAQLLERHPDLSDPAHMIWILRRALSVLGWAHKNGVVHGNVSPHTLRLRAADHNLWLHDWECACIDPALSGQGFLYADPLFSAPEVHQRKAPLPSCDLYALGRTMKWLLRGGHPTGELPQDTPEEITRLLRFMTLQSPTGRARDAWELYHEVGRIRRHLHGAHHFRPLI